LISPRTLFWFVFSFFLHNNKAPTPSPFLTLVVYAKVMGEKKKGLNNSARSATAVVYCLRVLPEPPSSLEMSPQTEARAASGLSALPHCARRSAISREVSPAPSYVIPCIVCVVCYVVLCCVMCCVCVLCVVLCM